MNRETIIQMARENGIAIGFDMAHEDEVACFSLVLLERFAAAIHAATKEEDARICEDSQKGDARKQSRYETARKIADAIRASK